MLTGISGQMAIDGGAGVPIRLSQQVTGLILEKCPSYQLLWAIINDEFPAMTVKFDGSLHPCGDSSAQ
jgi:hypothetical protein